MRQGWRLKTIRHRPTLRRWKCSSAARVFAGKTVVFPCDRRGNVDLDMLNEA